MYLIVDFYIFLWFNRYLLVIKGELIMNKYYIKSTFTIAKEFVILANSKEEAEYEIRDLRFSSDDLKESTVQRVRINSTEEVK